MATLENALAMTGCHDEADLIDMANVGRSLMDAIDSLVKCEGPFKHWSPADDPAEIVGDLHNALEEAVADKAASEPNNQLLERALPILIRQTRSLIECVCVLRRRLGAFEPIPGTCDPEAAPEIEEALQMIRDIECEVGPTTEPEPDWFEGLIDVRWSLTRKASANG